MGHVERCGGEEDELPGGNTVYNSIWIRNSSSAKLLCRLLAHILLSSSTHIIYLLSYFLHVSCQPLVHHKWSVCAHSSLLIRVQRKLQAALLTQLPACHRTPAAHHLDHASLEAASDVTLVCCVSLQAMLAFRTLVGFGIPGAVVAFNLLLEFTPTRLRGLFAVGIEGFWTLGTLLQAGMAYALLNTHGWR